MRLGEIKQKIDKVKNSENQIQINSAPLYGGQAVKVENYGEVMDVLTMLENKSWSNLNQEDMLTLLAKYPEKESETLEQEEFTKLTALVNAANHTLPVYYSILDDAVEVQDEQIINIMLPSSIGTLEGLAEFNRRLNSIFKKFQIDGEFKFHDFDKGTSWYEVLIVGVLSYKYFIACLKTAQEYLKTRTEYFKSQEAELSYNVAKTLSNNDKLTMEEFSEEYLKAYLKGIIKKLINDEIKETNGATEEELESKLVIATTELVKELGEGTEFHLSLNPPDYAKEQAGRLEIDYKKLQKLNPPASILGIAEREKAGDEELESIIDKK